MIASPHLLVSIDLVTSGGLEWCVNFISWVLKFFISFTQLRQRNDKIPEFQVEFTKSQIGSLICPYSDIINVYIVINFIGRFSASAVKQIV